MQNFLSMFRWLTPNFNLKKAKARTLKYCLSHVKDDLTMIVLARICTLAEHGSLGTSVH